MTIHCWPVPTISTTQTTHGHQIIWWFLSSPARGISDFFTDTQNTNRESGRKENKQIQTWVSSKCKHVFEQNSHQATRNADSSSHIGQPRSQCTGSSSCSLLLTALLSSVHFCWVSELPSLVPFRSHRKSHAQALLCGFHAKTDKRILWLAPTPRETNATHRVTPSLLCKITLKAANKSIFRQILS